MASEDDGSVEKMARERERMVQRRNPLQGALLRLRIEGDAMVDSNTFPRQRMDRARAEELAR